MSEEDTERSLLEQELEALRSSGAVADIYRERLVAQGIMARVLQWSRHVLVVEQLDDNYSYDGITAIRPGDVTRIRSDDRELLAARSLMVQPKPEALPEVALLEISAAVTILAKQHGAVTLHVEGLDDGMVFIGEPLGLDDDFIVLRAWGTVRNGDDSRVLLRLDEITRVDADTSYIRRLRQIRHG